MQQELQDRYLASIGAVAERIADLDNVLGYDTLNEPNGGYIGMRPRDFSRGRRFMARDTTGPEPRSPLEYLAAAEDGGIWTDGCPWREVGLWDRDADGQPVLANPEGLGGELWRDHMVPFAERFRDEVRARHAAASCSSRAHRWSSTPSGATPTRSSATPGTGTTS